MTVEAIKLDTLAANPSTPAADLSDAVPESGCQEAGHGTQVTEQEFSLPPTDRGKDAWLFLAACWAVEALVWGMS